ncbi:PhoH family protein [Candidatus Oleimmundimicrobium sp.]|uniref:PhoH family protein n=1 Tax=Candidatus Oleimmundimicrobium sp. TaxID=3060597 RepID=UPI002725979E|nr:PhoH family protein [Candidatus Oleimmundimicrobium sp.]MDO8885846.1 PhoH family protein [Candidatus Oleimmundimicrobium sp.]
MKTKRIKILVSENQPMVALLGHNDKFLNLIESKFNGEILVRGNEISITGKEDEVNVAAGIFKELLSILEADSHLDKQVVEQTIGLVFNEAKISPKDIFTDKILVHRGRIIRPKTAGQKNYIDAIRKNTITFAIGPAGTGKTYLAMAMAIKALKDQSVSRIILTRPAVEAGEKLGYLPGTLFEKVDPYLRPLFDALYDMMDTEQFQKMMEQGIIEVAPLAYMRGRTLNDSFILLDEAQNTSPEQMKMFLTRLGFGSKIVVTGDVTQVDLPRDVHSGLVIIEKILKELDNIAFIHLTADDVVRHKLVQKIVEVYREFKEKKT